nr:hypothetical protein [Tanacetum cinerariifolium]
GRMNEEDLFRVHDLSGDEVFVDVTTGENIKQDATVAEKKISTSDPVTTAVEVVIAEDVEDRVVESSKRVGEELEQENAKKQKLDEHVQAIVADDDTAELKKCLEIVPKDDDVTIEETPRSFKSPTIVDYKIYREGKKSYFKTIRADGNSQNYQTFRNMFKNFNREDLEVLRSIVKEKV